MRGEHGRTDLSPTAQKKGAAVSGVTFQLCFFSSADVFVMFSFYVDDDDFRRDLAKSSGFLNE